MRRVVCLLLAIGSIAAAAGCRLTDRDIAWMQPHLDDSVLAALKSRLKKDAWQRNSDWSLLEMTATPSGRRRLRHKPRWRFNDRLLPLLLKRIDEFADHPKTVLPPANDHLRILAETDGLIGWNATILLAQRRATLPPAAAKRLWPLFLKRMAYDPETGSSGGSERRRLPVGKDKKQKPHSLASSLSDKELQTSSLGELLELTEGRAKPQAATSWTRFFDKLPKSKTESTAPKNRRFVSPTLESAAAEAYCRIIANAADSPRQSLRPVARLAARPSLPRHVRREFLLNAARHVSPARIPMLAESIPPPTKANSRNLAQRESAVEACLLHALANRTAPKDPRDFQKSRGSLGAMWPSELHRAAHDPEPRIRALYGRWAAVAGHHDAEPILGRQLRDVHPTVRVEAITSLAALKTAYAKKQLDRAADDKSIEMRRAVVRGLAQWGPRELFRFLGDESPAVRREIAEAVAKLPSEESAALIQKLLRDSDRGVQEACIRATRQWDRELAVPQLLAAMESAPVPVAELAWRELKQRERLAGSFPVLATTTRRQSAVADLVKTYDLPRQLRLPSTASLTALNEADKNRLGRQIFEALTALATRRPGSFEYDFARRRIENLTRDSRPVLEETLLTFDMRLPSDFHEQILPKVHTNYGHLNGLSAPDPLKRQHAARQLAVAAGPNGAPLSQYVIREMIKRIAARPERHVWRHALQAMLHDSRPEADRFVIRAAQLDVAELQVLACRYFRRHPQPEFARHILDLMNRLDHRDVRLAAIKAAGASSNDIVVTGDPHESRTSGSTPRKRRRLGLRELMRSGDRQIAEAAATSLARLGFDAGYRHLHRITFHDDKEIRIRAYRLIGETGRERFADHLKRRLESERSPDVRSAIRSALKKLSPEPASPVASSGSSRYDSGVHPRSRRGENPKTTLLRPHFGEPR